MAARIRLSPKSSQAVERLLDVASRHRDFLGGVISEIYRVDARGNSHLIAGRERDFDKALAACLARDRDSLTNAMANLAAVIVAKADKRAWRVFQRRLAEIAGGASKWPEIARLMSAPVGNA